MWIFQAQGAQLLEALNEKPHLRPEGSPGPLLVEIPEKRVLLGIQQRAGAQPVGQQARQCRLAHPNGSLNGDLLWGNLLWGDLLWRVVIGHVVQLPGQRRPLGRRR